MFVLLLIMEINTWTITGKGLKTLYIEGNEGKIVKVLIKAQDSYTTLTVQTVLPPPYPFASKEEKVLQFNIPHPDDSLLMAWVDSPENNRIIVTKEGSIVLFDELEPYMTVKNRVGRVMLLQAPLSFFLTPLLGIWLGIFISGKSGEVEDMWDALPRWKTGKPPNRGDSELALVFGIVYQNGKQEFASVNRWKRSFDAISTTVEMWSYTNRLFSGGYRLNLFHTWFVEEDKFKNPVSTMEFRGFLLEVLGSIVPIHRPDFRFSLFGGEGFGMGYFRNWEWQTNIGSLIYEKGTSLILSLSFGVSIWVRLPNSPYSAVLEVSNRFRSDSYKSTDLQLGVGYVF